MNHVNILEKKIIFRKNIFVLLCYIKRIKSKLNHKFIIVCIICVTISHAFLYAKVRKKVTMEKSFPAGAKCNTMSATMENLIKECAIFKGLYIRMYVCTYILGCYVSSHHVAFCTCVLYTKDIYSRNEEKLEIVIHSLLLIYVLVLFLLIHCALKSIYLFLVNFQIISCIVIFSMYQNRSKLPSNPSWLSEGKSGLLEQSVPYRSIKIN